MKEISYDYLTEKLGRKRKIDQINENEYVITKDERTGQEFLLVVLQTENLRDTIGEVSQKIKNDYVEAEKRITQFGIVFSLNYVVFLRYKPGSLSGTQVQKLKKDLDKVDKLFKKKFKNLIKDPEEMTSWEALFDRTDMIEEFYKLYSKAKNNLLENIEGIYDDVKKEEFTDDLLMQLLIVWYLQEKGFLDNDNDYLVNRFKDYDSLGFPNYYSFLRRLFEVMMGIPNLGPFNDQTELGMIVITGPAPFLNGDIEEVFIRNKVFYIQGKTEVLKKSRPKNISEIPILNLFESRDWTEGNIDEFVLGAIYEKLMTRDKRKKTGAYYTPEEITAYISENCIKNYLKDRLSSDLNKDFKSFNQIYELEEEEVLLNLFHKLKDIKILDPAVGSAHFLESSINVLLDIYREIKEVMKRIGSLEPLEIKTVNEIGEFKNINLLEVSNNNLFDLYVKFFIILSKNIYGVDINTSALKVARARLFLTLAKHFDVSKENQFIKFPNVHFNLRPGNTLIGFTDIFKDDMEQTSIEFYLEEKNKITSIKRDSLNLLGELKEYLD